MNHNPIIKYDWFAAIILLSLAAIIRIPGIGSPISGDEALTFNQFAFQPWDKLVFEYLEPNQHSLFSILSNISMGIFGDNEWSFRLPSLLAGILTPALTYFTGFRLTGLRGASFVSGILISFSTQHLVYSQSGRGYALTVFLTLTFTLSLFEIIHGKKIILSTFLFFASGILSILALPTNTIFLAGTGVSFLLITLNQKDTQTPRYLNRIIKLIFFLGFLAIPGVCYLKLIEENLISGANLFKPQLLNLESLKNLFTPWTEPYGNWLYIFFVIGCFSLKNKREIFALIPIFLIPIIIMTTLGKYGFPRIYIFWLPFILIFISLGLTSVYSKFHLINHGKRIALSIFLASLIMIPTYRSLPKYYDNRSSSNQSLISEAKRIASYLESSVSKKTFIISLLGNKKSDILIYYLEERIGSDTLRFLSGEKPESIVLISHRNKPPDKFPIGGYFPNNYFKFPKKTFQEIYHAGNIGLYEFDVNINRFIPPSRDLDYEANLKVPQTKMVRQKFSTKIKILGQHSLILNKNLNEPLILAGMTSKKIKLKEAGYILLGYLKPYGKKSKLILWDKNKFGILPNIAYLNPYMGQAADLNSNIYWQMTFIIYPIAKGLNSLTEIFFLEENVSVFDGVQSFLLFPRSH